MVPKFNTIDDYLKTVTGVRRKALERLRKTIRSVIPKTEECISYGMPAFRLNGLVVAGFVATRKGCSYFPFSGKTLATLADDVGGYEQTKGALHFDPAKTLPAVLVRKLVKTRIAEVARPNRAVTARGAPLRRRNDGSRPAARSGVRQRPRDE
jgi:uncharacterized protein YdhG (YjbR/CyaY superfamily)